MIDALHDPGTPTAQARSGAAPDRLEQLHAPGGVRVLIGVASWTDPSMTAPGVFYPDGARTPEARLRYYATRFPLVEVDSTYYAIPARRMTELWVDRTPERFTFDVKAHALMTGQPSEVSRLPREIRDALPSDLAKKTRVYASDLPDELKDAVWQSFFDALVPLRDAGRLGAILLQYPRWVGPSRANATLIEDAQRRLSTGGWRAAVELRNRNWFDDRTRPRTLTLLRRTGLSYVVVDSPPGFQSSVPIVAEVTSPSLAIVRFHGRNTDTWEAKVTKVSDRFRYLYDETQLTEWVPIIQAISEQVEEVHLVFNNCYGNYGTTNALEMGGMLLRAGVVSSGR
ncbi:MAG TPA: DUF72 domain-containing protein [Gemmatimonadaceae bacterium]|nr:DUF72 domain-containing protein [Gemmatimonadaceae bacterium]